jgi:hypothetical protein
MICDISDPIILKRRPLVGNAQETARAAIDTSGTSPPHNLRSPCQEL